MESAAIAHESSQAVKAEKKGWLYRYNHKVCFPNWKQCWVVVYRHPAPRMCIYADRSECILDCDAQCMIDVGTIKISSKPRFPLMARAFNVHKSKPHSFEFVVNSPRMGPLIFAANNHQEKERWVNCLNEILNPLTPARKPQPEPIRYLLPKGPDILPTLSKSQILASSPSCFALQEQFTNIFAVDGMIPFSKKETAQLKRIKMELFNMVNFDKALHLDIGKRYPREAASVEELQKALVDFCKCPITESVEKQTLLLTAMRRFRAFASRVAGEVFEKHFRADDFNKCYKFGACVQARFLCDYARSDVDSINQKTVRLQRFLGKQNQILHKLLLNDVSVNFYVAVEHDGFVLLVQFQPPECELGVKMDDESYSQVIASKLGLANSDELVFWNYDLDSKLMCHVSYGLESFQLTAPEAGLELLDELSIISDGEEFRRHTLGEFLAACESSPAVHTRYFCLAELLGFAVYSLVADYSRRSRIESLANGHVEVSCFVINSLTDSDFFSSILKPKLSMLFKRPFILNLTNADYEAIDRRHVAEVALRYLGLHPKRSIKSIFPLDPADVNFHAYRPVGLEMEKLSADPVVNFYTFVSSKDPVKKISKDDAVAELLLQIVSSKETLSCEQKSTLSGLATHFSSPESGLLVSRCLVSFLKNTYQPDCSVALISGILERIKKELDCYFNFAVLSTLPIYDSLANVMHQLRSFDYSLSLNEECIGMCCKYLGRSHQRTVRFQEKIAIDQLEMNELDAALISFSECVRFMQGLSDYAGLSRMHLLMARCMFEKGDVGGALAYNEKSIANLRRVASSAHRNAFVEALMYQGNICESQFESLNSLASIITPQTEYYLNQAEQSLERALEFFKEHGETYAAHIVSVVERLTKIAILLLAPSAKDRLMMVIQRYKSSTLVDAFEREVLMSEMAMHSPSALLSLLLSAEGAGDSSSLDVQLKERKLYIAFKISALEFQ